MNFLTAPTPGPEAEPIHRVLRHFQVFLVTVPADEAIMEVPGGAAVTRRVLAQVAHPARSGGLSGLLTWAEVEIARSKIPAVDIVDHWVERHIAVPRGNPEPQHGMLFHYGASRLLAHVDAAELHDAAKLADVLEMAILRERLALHAHRLG